MRKKHLSLCLLCILILTMFPITASADSGPKPSVHIDLLHVKEEACYGTLLSKEDSTGPAYVWDGTEDGIRLSATPDVPEEEARRIWQAFIDYQDPDGFYFLQWFWNCSNGQELAWTYYPPEEFKVLLYYPESGKFITSEICRKYAFDSYFTMDLSDDALATVNAGTAAMAPIEKSYNYGKEIGLFAGRILLTLAIELAVALLFGFRKKKTLCFIAAINLMTQILLNLALSAIKFQSGYLMFRLSYFGLEFVVFAIEAAAYVIGFKKYEAEDIKKGRIVLYSLLANFASFILGFVLSAKFPRLF